MKRKTKKVEKEGDTCRDCWTQRFRKDIYKQWEEETSSARSIPLSDFLKRELVAREEVIQTQRDELRDLYDEISAIEHLAGDVYMGRYKEGIEEE